MLRQWLQQHLLDVLVEGVGSMTGLRMHPAVAHIAQPLADFCVGSGSVDDQAAGPHPAVERDVEVAAQVAVEAPHLALGPCTVWAAQARYEAVQLRHVHEVVIPVVPAFTVRVAFDHRALGVVVQDLPRYAPNASNRAWWQATSVAAVSSEVKRTQRQRL